MTNTWEEAMNRGVQFTSQTRCATLDIIHLRSLAQPHLIEGTVTHATLSVWLDQVC